ncbi:Major facilitator superfamily domain general substrate transporter [Penicillium manginii]|uniref:Major facilitator superfamily domain general substrate transporter n=1 Tax=Penicillium manginii TaxID=203109 RepID=UPI002546C1EB|nr:Major facilitator superfamily domain general substrate transporter [Penicillium manginii]KAJ5754233.1 Major facilitator superfamily domain general substrate transporter [Penicillium manginii]
MENSPSDSIMKMDDSKNHQHQEDWDLEQAPQRKSSGIFNVFIAGLALASDGYNAHSIGYMMPLFTNLYKYGMSSTIKARLTNSYLIGEIFGMIFFGILIDRVGRRTGILATTLFLVLGLVLSTASHGTSELGMFWMMIVARGIAGFGAGGEYPVCGTSATEAADESHGLRRRRGFLVAITTDTALDLGAIVAGIVAVIVLAAYNHHNSEGIWRICFGLGFILPIAVCFFRIRMLNSTQYRKHAIKSNYPYMLVLHRYWKPMLGTALAWFCYDFVTYPFSLFSSTIVQQFNPKNTAIQNVGYGYLQTVINCFQLPGCFLGGYLMDRIGRKQTMALGFFLWAIWGFIIGGALHPIQSIFPLFVVMYGIFQALGEMGPGVATFLCGSESFPTPLRGHFLGCAAAVGKAGASIGIEVFAPIQHRFHTTQKGQQAVFLIGSAFCIVGALITWFLVPDMSRELETEDARFKAYLEENGYDITSYGEEQLIVQHK